jgi:hypothetical protein
MVKRLALFLVAAAYPLAGQRGPAPRDWQEFVSRQGGYAVHFPKSWHVLAPPVPTLYICNFPPSQRVPAVIVPQNGATISVTPPPVGVDSAEQWIGGVSAAIRVRSRKSTQLQMAAPAPPLHIDEVIYLSTEGPDTTSWYFDVSGRVLRANLSYWEGDPREGEYRRVLADIVRTIIPLPR